MLIVCPNCAARYEVAALALPAQGREVECSACGHLWLHLPPPDARRAAPAAPAPADAEGAPPELAEAATVTGAEISEPAPEPEPEPEPEPDFALSPIEARLPPEVLALLREEASRELEARRAEARGAQAVADAAPRTADAPPEASVDPIPETTPEVPPEAAPEAEPEAEPGPAVAEAPPEVPRAPPAPVWPVEAEPAPLWTPAPAPSEGPSGLALAGALGLLALSIAALIYVGAPALGRAVPSLGPILSVYVDAADWILAGLRGWILALPSRLAGG